LQKIRACQINRANHLNKGNDLDIGIELIVILNKESVIRALTFNNRPERLQFRKNTDI
jgi:hypothetical protein